MANAERLLQALTYVEQHPEQWGEMARHHGAGHCFCGTAQILAGHPADNRKLRAQVREWLDLTSREFWLLVDYNSTLESMRCRVGRLIEGYDRNGYDRDGYDRDGCDRAGYDVAGYDRMGYDCYGYNRNGYSRHGRDRDGYDSDGLDANNKPRSVASV